MENFALFRQAILDELVPFEPDLAMDAFLEFDMGVDEPTVN